MSEKIQLNTIFNASDEELIEVTTDFNKDLLLAGTQTGLIKPTDLETKDASSLIYKCFNDHITYCQAIGNIREALIDFALTHKKQTH